MPFPSETGNLRAITNLGDVWPFATGIIPNETLVTDTSWFAHNDNGKPWCPDIKSPLDQLHATQQRMPLAIVGRYHSSRFAIPPKYPLEKYQQGTGPWMGRVPTEHYAPQSLFDASELFFRQPYWHEGYEMPMVDFRQPKARKKLIQAIVDNAVKGEARALMTDEWVTYARWDGIAWKDYGADYLEELTDALHAKGILHFPNIDPRLKHYNPDVSRAASDAYIRRIAKSCDVMVLEGIYPIPTWLPIGSKTTPKDVLHDLEVINDCGVPGVLATADDSGKLAAGISALTGWKNYVMGPINDLPPKWIDWPKQFGKPTSEVVWISESVAARWFERGVVRVDFGKRIVGVVGVESKAVK